MANDGRGKVLNYIKQNIVLVFIVLVVLFLVIPIPKLLIDLCMILNIALGIIILLVVLKTARPSELQTFPRIILIQTMFSLAVNVSSTRLILMGRSGYGGVISGQSNMVQAFARITAGNSLVIGAIIFVILIIVQLLVVNKGASRVSEVAARFTLDSMTTKLLEIDNRFNQGAIDADEAERLKAQIRREIDFYANMDGASKFVSGNVKAGVFITIVNLVGGFIIGMVMNKMNFNDALSTYTTLTIGDGLTSQVPSLIISFATGLLVTGTKNDENFDEQLASEFARDGHTYEIGGGVLAIAGLVLRGNTQWLLMPIGALFIFIGYRINQKVKREDKARAVAEANAKTSPQSHNVDEEKIAMLDPLSLELGYALISLVDEQKGAELIAGIKRMRSQCIYDMGFDIPKIRILDNTALKPDEYSFKIEGIEAGHASIRPGYIMCMDTGNVITPLEGERTKDPAFGMDAIWIPESKKAEADAAGYTTVDANTVILTHLTQIIQSHAAKLLDRQAVSTILEEVRKKQPVLVQEVLETAHITHGQIQKVFQNLLEEKVSIRNYSRILETMANYSTVSNNIWDLTQKVREALGLQICMQYVDPEEKKLRVLRLSQEFTDMIAEHAVYPKDGSKPFVGLDIPDTRTWITSVSSALAKTSQMGYYPIILCVSPIRQLVKSSIEREQPGVVVISDMEIMAAGSEISVEIISELGVETAE